MTLRKKDSMLLPDNVPLIVNSHEVREANPGTREEWSAVINVKLSQIWWNLLGPTGRAELQKTSIPQEILRGVLTEMNAAALMKVNENVILKIKADAIRRSALDVMMVSVVQKANADGLVLLDELIIYQAGTLRQMQHSSIVDWRKASWVSEPNGQSLLRRYNRAIEEADDILRGCKLRPLTTELKPLFKHTVRELNPLLLKLRKYLAARHRFPTAEEFIATFRAAVDPKFHRQIYGNLEESWIPYLTAALKPDHPDYDLFKRLFIGKKVTPERICYQWLAHCTRYSQKSLKQALWKL